MKLFQFLFHYLTFGLIKKPLEAFIRIKAMVFYGNYSKDSRKIRSLLLERSIEIEKNLFIFRTEEDVYKTVQKLEEFFSENPSSKNNSPVYFQGFDGWFRKNDNNSYPYISSNQVYCDNCQSMSDFEDALSLNTYPQCEHCDDSSLNPFNKKDFKNYDREIKKILKKNKINIKDFLYDGKVDMSEIMLLNDELQEEINSLNLKFNNRMESFEVPIPARTASSKYAYASLNEIKDAIVKLNNTNSWG